MTLGEFDGQRYYLRVDTGALFGTETFAWVSASRQENRDWGSSAPWSRSAITWRPS